MCYLYIIDHSFMCKYLDFVDSTRDVQKVRYKQLSDMFLTIDIKYFVYVTSSTMLLFHVSYYWGWWTSHQCRNTKMSFLKSLVANEKPLSHIPTLVCAVLSSIVDKIVPIKALTLDDDENFGI